MINLLFEIEKTETPNIPGLSYLPEFISGEEEQSLIARIDQQPWSHDLKRRVQHYGYKYDYKARAVTNDAYLGPLPDWLISLAQRLNQEGLFPAVPDQVIVNEYQPGQGISAHIDCVPCFGDVIASLSLGSSCVMQFARDGFEKQEIILEPRSLILLSSEARYDWQHAIPARKSDNIDGFKIQRDRRVSLTFRSVIR